MADEQLRLRQDILDAIKEQTARTDKYRDETRALNQFVLARQRRVSRVALALMLATIAFLAFIMVRRSL
jgi:hypothetical protein